MTDPVRPPAVSVVMTVRNGLPYLDDSIESMRAQTLEDFEFLILDDRSTDGTSAALRDWAQRDRRIRVCETRRPLGPAEGANRITAQAAAPVVARMDADDVSHPDRLRRQWEALHAEPDVALVGTLADGIDSRGRRARPRDRWRLIGSSAFAPFPHGSCMFRRALFEEVGGYRVACEPWEDQDLMWRMADRGRVMVLPDALYRYRYHARTTTLAYLDEGAARAYRLRDRCLAERRAGRDYTNVLEAAAREGRSQKATAGALRSAGALRLWAGHRPGILGALLRDRSLGWSHSAPRVLLLATWGTLSPGSLRLVLRAAIGARDRVAGLRLKGSGPREWRFG
jgi:glycosyltransferase involved in cell wall biosynthesis